MVGQRGRINQSRGVKKGLRRIYEEIAPGRGGEERAMGRWGFLAKFIELPVIQWIT